MWQRMAFVITVVLLGVSGGIIALFVRGIGAERGAIAGFSVVSAVAVVQSWMVASEIARARRLSGDIRNACYRGAQAKFRAVLDCVQLQRSFPCHSRGQTWGHQVDSPPSC